MAWVANWIASIAKESAFAGIAWPAWWKERSQDLRKFTYVSSPRWDYLRTITYYLRSLTYVVLRGALLFFSRKNALKVKTP
jgi:hypothetical protein